VLLDANLLLYAVDRGSSRHEPASAWLTGQLNGSRRVALPWQTVGAFLRIATHPRALPRPLGAATAWERIRDWIEAPAAWIPTPGPDHARLLGQLVTAHDVRGNLVPDAQLAALALEHGLTVCSTDTDFGRFTGVPWIDPLA